MLADIKTLEKNGVQRRIQHAPLEVTVPVGFRVHRMSPDGDCFYHCMSRGLADAKQVSRSAFELRADFATILMTEERAFQDTLIEWRDHGVIAPDAVLTHEDASKRITERKEWATESVIHWLAVLHRVFVHVFEKQNGSFREQRFPEECKIKGGTFQPPSEKRFPHIYVLFSNKHFDYLTKE